LELLGEHKDGMDLKGVIIFEVTGHSLKHTEVLWQKEIMEACDACDGWKNWRLNWLGFVRESSEISPLCHGYKLGFRVCRDFKYTK